MTPTTQPPSQALPASFTGRWVSLRPVSRDDFITLFGWRVDAFDLQHLLSSKRIPTYEEFVSEQERLLSQSLTLIANDQEGGAPIGFVQAYNTNLEQGWSFMLCHFIEEFRPSPQAIEACAALIDLLFRRNSLRKIYMDMFEFRVDSLKALLEGAFEEEGRFGEHVWYEDRYWDLVRFAVYREGWAENQKQVLFRVSLGEEAAEAVAGEA